MQRVDRSHSSCNGWTLDIDVALRRALVHINVQHTPMLVAFFYHIITDFLVPVQTILSAMTYKGQGFQYTNYATHWPNEKLVMGVTDLVDSLTLHMHVPHFSLVLPSLVLQQQRPPLPAFMNMKSHKNVSSCIYYHAHFTHLLLRSGRLLQEQNDKCTHDPESNMLDSMKHWVAMGGAAVAAAGMGGS